VVRIHYRIPLIIGATVMVGACSSSQPPASGSKPKGCDLQSWLAQHAAEFPFTIVPWDRLDARLERVSTLTGGFPRPNAFVHGYEAELEMAVLIDSSGHVARVDPVDSQVWTTYASTPPTPAIRVGFEEEAAKRIRLETFTKPHYHGTATAAITCIPFAFSER
jgi:hypothetical protein